MIGKRWVWAPRLKMWLFPQREHVRYKWFEMTCSATSIRYLSLQAHVVWPISSARSPCPNNASSFLFQLKKRRKLQATNLGWFRRLIPSYLLPNGYRLFIITDRVIETWLVSIVIMPNVIFTFEKILIKFIIRPGFSYSQQQFWEKTAIQNKKLTN